MTDHETLTEALGAFQADLPKVGKGSTNPAFKSKYADLADIVTVVLPALAKHGLAWASTPTVTEDGFVLRYELRHTSGQSLGGDWPLPDPDKSSPQVLGSALTYGRRYTLSAVTGIAPDDDDDGNFASAAAPSHRRSFTPRPAPEANRAAQAIPALKGQIMNSASLDELQKAWGQVALEGHGHDAGLIAAKDARKTELSRTPQELTTEWAATKIPDGA